MTFKHHEIVAPLPDKQAILLLEVAMLWATAKRAGCRLLLSEDDANGRRNVGKPVWLPALAAAVGSAG